jgi:hypothetical protein
MKPLTKVLVALLIDLSFRPAKLFRKKPAE